MVSVHDVLRALVRGEHELLNDAEWQGEALAAIDAHDQAAAPAPEASAEVPEPAAAVPDLGEPAPELPAAGEASAEVPEPAAAAAFGTEEESGEEATG